MAKINPTEFGENLFGKIGGQSLSLTRNGNVIKNTSYPRLTATPKQSIQRMRFASLTSHYASLSGAQKIAWGSTAINYTWLDSAGNVRTRNAFQTFNFCNQNLILLDLPILDSPETYAPIIQAGITKEPSAPDEFVIKGADTKAYQQYLVFATVHNSLGNISQQQRPLLIGVLEYDVLAAGADIGPKLRGTFPEVTFQTSITIKVTAVNIDNGNRDLEGEVVNGVFVFAALGLDILSYYPFNTDFDDYFNINNPTNVNAVALVPGVVSGGAEFNRSLENYLSFGTSDSLNFIPDGNGLPFSIAFWFKDTDTASNAFFALKIQTGTTNGSKLLLSIVDTYIQVGVMSNISSRQRRYRYPITRNAGINYFIAFRYSSEYDFSLTVNGNLATNLYEGSGYSGLHTLNVPAWFGFWDSATKFYANGILSELTFFNQAVTPEEFEYIRLANLEGQTILDIN